jgi:hypothetical protein
MVEPARSDACQEKPLIASMLMMRDITAAHEVLASILREFFA